MKRRLTISLTIALLLAMLISSVAFATVWTNQVIYYSGDTVYISGNEMQGGETVGIIILYPDGSQAQYHEVTANEVGNFNDTYVVPDNAPIGDFTVIATGQSSGNTFSTTFDPPPVRNYSATISPTSDTAGHALSAYTLTIKNETISNQDLGSVNISVPVGYSSVVLGTVTAPTSKTWTASLVSGVIQLRSNASANRLLHGESVSVALTATSACSSGSYTWTAVAKQSTDFNGSENFTIVGSHPAVSVTGSCDATPPTASPKQSPVKNANGWNNTNVTVDWNWTDNAGGSGIDSANCTTSTVASNEGEYNITATCYDKAGNKGTASYAVKIDKTAPTISAMLDKSAAGTGWFNASTGAPTVNFTCSDALSGLAAACPASHPFGDGENQAYSQTIYDLAGNSASAGVSDVDVDTVAPAITASVSPDRPASGWWNFASGAPTVSFTCSDVTSDLAGACPADNTFLEGKDQSYSQTIYDNAGNSASAGVTDIDVDLTAPSISAAATTLPNEAGWYNTNVTIHFTCFDALSGIPDGACPADQVLSAEGAAVASTAQTVTDAAGNTSNASNVVTVKIDMTKPTISAAATTDPNLAGWYNSNVTVRFTCTDTLSGIPAGACPADQVLSTEGAAVASTAQTVTDAAGNTSVASNVVTVKIDKTKPTISAAATTVPNAAGWYNANVIVRFTCTDALSGIPYEACPADQVLSTEGEAVASTAQMVTDAAGNTSDLSNVITVKIDKTAPSLTWYGGPADGASYYFGFVPAAPTCTAADALSGPNGCEVTGYDIAVGSHTLTATAYDKAGNSKVETRSYSVLAWTLNGFFPPVDMPTPTKLVYNTVKGGSTVPLKFEIFAGTTELTDVSAVKSFTYAQTSCDATAITDDIETLATGGTALRYDSTGGQFIYNWKTPIGAGKCYRTTMTALDGSTLVAYFKTK